MERDRHYGHNRHQDHDHYRDIDIEEGLMDSAEQSLQDINRTSKSDQTNSPHNKADHSYKDGSSRRQATGG